MVSEFDGERLRSAAAALYAHEEQMSVDAAYVFLFGPNQVEHDYGPQTCVCCSCLAEDAIAKVDAVLKADEAYRREQRQRHMAEADFCERPRGLPGTFNGA